MMEMGKIEMIKTGIPKLDDFLGGGVPKGKTLCYYIQPGVVGEVFGMQALAKTLEEGGEGVFVSTTMEPSMAREQFKEYGWDVEEYGDRLAIVDAYSGLIGLKSDEKYLVENPNDIDSLGDTITQAIEDLKPGSVIYASLSQIIDFTGANIEKYVSEWNKRILDKKAVGVYSFTAWPYPNEIRTKVKEFFNSVVEVVGIGEIVLIGNYYSILRADWCDVVNNYVLFETEKPGGIKDSHVPMLKRQRLRLLMECNYSLCAPNLS